MHVSISCVVITSRGIDIYTCIAFHMSLFQNICLCWLPAIYCISETQGADYQYLRLFHKLIQKRWNSIAYALNPPNYIWLSIYFNINLQLGAARVTSTPVDQSVIYTESASQSK